MINSLLMPISVQCLTTFIKYKSSVHRYESSAIFSVERKQSYSEFGDKENKNNNNMNSNEMIENQEQLYDPKGLGRPPPYTEFATPPPAVVQPVPVAVPAPVPVIVQQPIPAPISVSMPDNVGPEAMSMICKSCNKQIYTRVEYKPTTNTYLIAGLCCLLFCWPCACCVYCSASCRNTDHYCPNCDTYIGTYTH